MKIVLRSQASYEGLKKLPEIRRPPFDGSCLGRVGAHLCHPSLVTDTLKEV